MSREATGNLSLLSSNLPLVPLWPHPPPSQSEGHPGDTGLRCQPTRAPNCFSEREDWFYGARSKPRIPSTPLKTCCFHLHIKTLPPSGFWYLTVHPPCCSSKRSSTCVTFHYKSCHHHSNFLVRVDGPSDNLAPTFFKHVSVP